MLVASPPVRCACPSCRLLLQVAQAPPFQVRCPRCQTIFQVRAAPLAPRQPKPSAAPAAPPRRRALQALLTAVAALAVTGLGVSAFYLQDREPDAAPPQAQAARPLSPQEQKIHDATERGVAYLKQRLLSPEPLFYLTASDNAAHIGAAALAGLTLLECGLPPSDPAVTRALETLRTRAPRLSFTYSVALAVLFLDRLDEAKVAGPGERALIRRLALRLVAGENNRGGWEYYCPVLSPEQETDLLDRLQKGQAVAGDAPQRDDNSNTQFAALALWVARRHGVPVGQPLALVEARFRNSQAPDGSWNYTPDGGRSADPMTCAGLLGLALGRGVRDEQLTKADPAFERALQALAAKVGQAAAVPPEESARRTQAADNAQQLYKRWEAAAEGDRPGIEAELNSYYEAGLNGGILGAQGYGDLYYLWSLARVAVACDLQTVHGKDWYAWGSDLILKSQRADGSWRDRFPGVPDTCFALLFLKRANVVKDLTARLRAAREGGPAVQTPGRKD